MKKCISNVCASYPSRRWQTPWAWASDGTKPYAPSTATPIRASTFRRLTIRIIATFVGRHGGTIDLVMHRENLKFKEACLWLADAFGVYVGDGSRKFSDRSSRRLSQLYELANASHVVVLLLLP